MYFRVAVIFNESFQLDLRLRARAQAGYSFLGNRQLCTSKQLSRLSEHDSKVATHVLSLVENNTQSICPLEWNSILANPSKCFSHEYKNPKMKKQPQGLTQKADVKEIFNKAASHPPTSIKRCQRWRFMAKSKSFFFALKTFFNLSDFIFCFRIFCLKKNNF